MDDATKDDFCLIAKERVRGRFARDVFADSHGAFDGVLGCGYLYYGFAAAVRAQVSVCVGSGAGFVPDLLAQAQKDLGLTPAATYLVDANLPDLGFGSPIQNGGWLRPDNDFLRRAAGVRSTIARGPLEPSAGEPAQATGRFEIAPGDAPQPVEIRTFFGGRGSLTVAAVAIHREAQGEGPSSAQNL